MKSENAIRGFAHCIVCYALAYAQTQSNLCDVCFFFTFIDHKYKTPILFVVCAMKLIFTMKWLYVISIPHSKSVDWNVCLNPRKEKKTTTTTKNSINFQQIKFKTSFSGAEWIWMDRCFTATNLEFLW